MPFLFFRRFCKSYYGEDGRNPVPIYREKSRGESLCSIEKLHVFAKRKWIDAGGNPAVRHEGVPPSNNLIKDGTHRATVFVGPTLKSFSFLFSQIWQIPLWKGRSSANGSREATCRAHLSDADNEISFFLFSPNLPWPLWR